MKYVIGIFIVLFTMTACNKDDDDNKRTGVCYCDFANGQKQEYDLTHLARQSQIDTCNNHNKNAGNFGGVCKLK